MVNCIVVYWEVFPYIQSTLCDIKGLHKLVTNSWVTDAGKNHSLHLFCLAGINDIIGIKLLLFFLFNTISAIEKCEQNMNKGFETAV